MAGENRWVRDIDERHLLLHAGTRYVEWHGTVVHVYDGPETADVDNPLDGAVYVRTEPRGLHEASVAELWEILADPRYTDTTEETQ